MYYSTLKWRRAGEFRLWPMESLDLVRILWEQLEWRGKGGYIPPPATRQSSISRSEYKKRNKEHPIEALQSNAGCSIHSSYKATSSRSASAAPEKIRQRARNVSSFKEPLVFFFFLCFLPSFQSEHHRLTAWL